MPSDADVRLCVLASLDETFDRHLAQPENLNALIYALSDEVFEVSFLDIDNDDYNCHYSIEYSLDL